MSALLPPEARSWSGRAGHLRSRLHHECSGSKGSPVETSADLNVRLGTREPRDCAPPDWLSGKACSHDHADLVPYTELLSDEKKETPKPGSAYREASVGIAGTTLLPWKWVRAGRPPQRPASPCMLWLLAKSSRILACDSDHFRRAFSVLDPGPGKTRPRDAQDGERQAESEKLAKS